MWSFENNGAKMIVVHGCKRGGTNDVIDGSYFCSNFCFFCGHEE